jgi:Zn-dependent protease
MLFKTTVLIKAPREVVWQTVTVDRIVFDGPPVREEIREPLPADGDLHMIRTLVNGEETSRVVFRELSRDEEAGTLVTQAVPHPLTQPPDLANDCVTRVQIEKAPQGTSLTISDELAVRSFRERLTYPFGVATRAFRIKRQCEWPQQRSAQAGAGLGKQGLTVSFIALLSFWFLFGWQDALLLAVIIVLHEAGHAAAMRLVGMKVQGIYLVPFFGGAAVPKSAYKSQGHLGFVALMGPGFSLIPTLGLLAAYLASEDARLLHAVSLFALINAINLLPIYPLDGGMIVNALLASLSRRLALVWGWIGVLTGLGIAFYLQSLLIGIPFLLFALQRYLRGGQAPNLKRLSIAGATGLVFAFAATFVLHVLAFGFAEDEKSMILDGGASRALMEMTAQ